jgi:hypothetical protein
MNLLEKLKNYAGGVAILRDWVGANAAPVKAEKAQGRADVCLCCPKNQKGVLLADAVAEAIKQQMEFKNHLELHVNDESDLHTCAVCDCNLPLMVWCPDEMFTKHYTQADAVRYPDFCWKRKLIVQSYA